MAGFNQDQVRQFRTVYSQHSDEEAGGVTAGNFSAAVSECLQHMTLVSEPTSEFVAGEFERLGGSGAVTWQQFFQVLIHINLTFGPVSQRASQAPPTASPEATPPPVEAAPPLPPRAEESRVHFSIEEVAPPPHVTQPQQPAAESAQHSFGNTLGRLGRVVGNFFGVTEASQHGTAGNIGWEEWTEQRVNEDILSSLPVVRRQSLSRRPPPAQTSSRGDWVSFDDEPPPDYPAVTGGRSFDPQELGDSDEEEEESGFISAAPPAYTDVVTHPVGVPAARFTSTGPQLSGVTRVSAYIPAEEQQTYPVPTYPSQQQQQSVAPPPSTAPTPDEFITDSNQAWDYYLRFVRAERALRQRRTRDDAVEFFGTTELEGSAGGGGRRERLHSVTAGGESGAGDGVVQRRKKKKKKKKKNTKLQRQSTLIRSEVERLPSFWPVFIILVTIAEVIGMIVLLSLPSIGLAPIHVFPRPLVGEFPSLTSESGLENITYFRSVNLWIGPSPRSLIHFGAKFTPCMRTDFGIHQRNSLFRSSFGCCQNQQHVGVSFVQGCLNTTSNVTVPNTDFEGGDVICSNVSRFNPPGPNLHPCCVSITGQCLVTSFDECDARQGVYHPNNDSCSQVNCMRDVCGFNEAFIGERDDDPLLPTANQFWRWIISIFLHLGVLHMIPIVPIQLYVGIKIERTIGWLRVGIIYVLSGVGGNIVSAIFVPYEVNAGASGAVFGLLGVLFVELFQFWQIVDNAFLELLKLSAFVVFLLVLGTLPYIDNFAHIGGLMFGVVSAIIFVPYITFGKWDAFRKRILLIICIPLLIALYVAGFVTFYLLRSDPNFCRPCQYINCVPYAPGLCPAEYNDVNPTNFSL